MTKVDEVLEAKVLAASGSDTEDEEEGLHFGGSILVRLRWLILADDNKSGNTCARAVEENTISPGRKCRLSSEAALLRKNFSIFLALDPKHMELGE